MRTASETRWTRATRAMVIGLWLALGSSGAHAQPGADEEAGGQRGDGLAIMMAAETAVTRAIDRAAPSVVAIARVKRDGPRDVAADFQFNAPGLDQPLGDLFGEDIVPTEFGSGVIISADGAILTCYHLLDDPRENDYYVWLAADEDDSAGDGDLSDGAATVRLPARVSAGDPWTDLAVLRVDATDLPVMPVGDASELRRGNFVISLGNPYAVATDGRASASWGIIANLQRRAPPIRDSETEISPPESLQEFGTLIQTDARLNLGTSGGALVNLRGEMVGLTTSLAAVAGYEQAAGFAIPIDKPTLAVIGDLSAGRAPAFGFLGVEPIDAAGGGALVRRVVPGMPADRAGLRPGDVIVGVDGLEIDGAEGLFREMSRRAADSQTTMSVVKAGSTEAREITVRLGKKRLALGRPSFSQVAEPTWRGMQVDFSSALPPDRLMLGRSDKPSDAAIVSVDPDSPAWRAGLRPGQLVTAVDGERITRPDEFHGAVESASGTVTIEVEDRLGAKNTIRVPAQEP